MYVLKSKFKKYYTIKRVYVSKNKKNVFDSTFLWSTYALYLPYTVFAVYPNSNEKFGKCGNRMAPYLKLFFFFDISFCFR